MLELLDYPFMRYALAAAVVTGLTAPAIGTFLVQRRLALLGDGIGHVALTGVALGLLTGTAPVLTAVIAATLGALAIELMRTYARTSGDVALAMLFYGGIAAGVMLINLAGDSAATLNSYLFGSIVTVSPDDLTVIAILGGIVLVVVLAATPQLFAVCQDEEHARVSGVPVRWYGILIAVLAAVTITVAMRTVGLLLVSALMVVPVAAAQQVARSFRATHLLAMGLGLLAAIVGVIASFEIDTQPGPTIVLTAMLCFAVLAAARGVMTLTRRWRRRPLELG
ncbi:MAG: metal ABC transporter permease [Aeromicrobium sp.]|uniref:metal ABC transporter permease n=1 Tax=Aeromicrobium sp. TaxID=1871063 RepID=UPI00260F0741|nr:metal ABC transporter permease [Aeromicrobium sp.]MDF1705496.1 metal ABC transporter permease [Aeromicrobium sp.]